ncbi:cyclase family protein [Acetoanaerobium noterae]|uniref:cyclase family protein n=1 Tax=Acetoanaerobium noterae TaxID=745369 RepID=UPI0028AC6755|nr:cyclase family protein [Acetoanaerobium noterae]
MKIFDLTHMIKEQMPVYPGTEPPSLKNTNTIEVDGFAEKLFSMYSHTGTHIDAPKHMVEEGLGLDDFDISKFVGKAILIDVTEVSDNITLPDLIDYERFIENSDFVIFYTGWSKYWGSDQYFDNFPVLEHDAAKWLSNFKLKGIGIDAISIDAVDTVDFDNHYVFLNQNFIIIENLTNLSEIPEKQFTFSALPLKTFDADGSPTRAIAML